MSIFSRLFSSNEIKMIIESINEPKKNLDDETFYIIREKNKQLVNFEINILLWESSNLFFI